MLFPVPVIVGRYGLCYRQDWADEAWCHRGLPENATPDDVYNMLYTNSPMMTPMETARTIHIGMEMTSVHRSISILSRHGSAVGNGWAEVDGTAGPCSWMQPEY